MRMIDGDELVMWLSKWMMSSFGTEQTEETEAIRKVCDAVGDMVKDLAKDTGGDLISRQAAIDALGEEPPVWYDGEDEIAERDQWRRDVAAIKALPSAEPERINGHWIDAVIPNDSGGLPVIVCDKCNTFFPLQFGDGHNFCPNCGADMREGGQG